MIYLWFLRHLNKERMKFVLYWIETDEIGEIVFKSPSNTIGYLKNEEETKKTIVNGWLKTGDLGYIDSDGYLFIVDRKKALIIRGGENISCLERSKRSEAAVKASHLSA